MENTKKSRTGCLWAVVVTQALLLVALVLVVVIVMAVRSSFRGRPERGADEFPELSEVWSCGSGELKVVRVPLVGAIFLGEAEGWVSGAAGSAQLALMSIRRATLDEDVQAIILDVDSGGGGITASDVIYNALVVFKAAQEGRVVVSIFGDVAASGAYYIAAASDYILARPTTVTGSIGVLIQTLNFHELGVKYGIKDVTIKSGKYKDILNPLQDVSDEHRAVLQALVDEMHARFIDIVCEGRNLPIEEVKQMADGRVFVAGQALDMGLIDEVGYWEDAMVRTAELLGTDGIRVYRYEEEFSLSSFLKAFRPLDPMARLFPGGLGTRLLYFWRP